MFGFAPIGALPIGGFPGPPPAGGDRVIECETGSYALTGTAVGLVRPRSLTLSSSSYVLGGDELWMEQGGAILSTDVGAYVVSGASSALLMGRVLQIPVFWNSLEPLATAAAERFRTVGSPVNLIVSTPTVTAVVGAYAIDGSAVSLLYKRSIPLVTGTYAITGVNPAVVRHFDDLDAVVGTYAQAGSAVTFVRTVVAALDEGTYEIDGPDAGVLRGFKATIELGVYEVEGEDVIANREREKQINLGLYELNGEAAALRAARDLPAEEGEFEIEADDVTFTRGKVAELDAGGYAIAGAAATLPRGIVVELEEGEFEIDGPDLEPGYLRRMVISGAYTFAEFDIDILRTRNTVLAAGAYAISGRPLEATFTRQQPGPRHIVPGAQTRYVAPDPLPRRVVVGPAESRYLAVPARERLLAA